MKSDRSLWHAVDEYTRDTSGEEEEEIRITVHGKDASGDFYGADTDGNTWSQFTVDMAAGQTPGTCAICGVKLWAGWMNHDCAGDGCVEVCEGHVVVAQ